MRFLLLGLFVLATLLVDPTVEPPEDAQRKAVKAVTKVGGVIIRDQATRSRPVVAVTFVIPRLDGTANLKELVAFEELRTVSIVGTKITVAGMMQLARLKAVRTLHLHDTKLENGCLKELATMTWLRSLELSGVHLTDAGAKELATLKDLRWLNLSQNDVTEAGIKGLVGCDLPYAQIIQQF